MSKGDLKTLIVERDNEERSRRRDRHRLNLSEGSVALRLKVANVSRRFPQLLVSLAENRLSLTVAGKLEATRRATADIDFHPKSSTTPSGCTTVSV